MTTAEKKTLREQLAKRTKTEMDALWSNPDFWREHVAWEKEYTAAGARLSGERAHRREPAFS